MIPEQQSDSDDLLDPDMDFIVDELCDYVSKLNPSGSPSSTGPSSERYFASRMRSTIDECRSILEFLHESRNNTPFSLSEPTPNKTWQLLAHRIVSTDTEFSDNWGLADTASFIAREIPIMIAKWRLKSRKSQGIFYFFE